MSGTNTFRGPWAHAGGFQGTEQRGGRLTEGRRPTVEFIHLPERGRSWLYLDSDLNVNFLSKASSFLIKNITVSRPVWLRG